jgi:hypothetical protein
MFLDEIIISIKYCFKSAGYKNWQLLENSVKCLLNKNKIERYKKEIDYDFFEELKEKINWIYDFKKSRDTLIHHHSELLILTDKEGKLGFKVSKIKDQTWKRSSFNNIFRVLQTTINDLSDLITYLSKNLPRAV